MVKVSSTTLPIIYLYYWSCSFEEDSLKYHIYLFVKLNDPLTRLVLIQGYWIEQTRSRSTRQCYTPYIKIRSLAVYEKNILSFFLRQSYSQDIQALRLALLEKTLSYRSRHRIKLSLGRG